MGVEDGAGVASDGDRVNTEGFTLDEKGFEVGPSHRMGCTWTLQGRFLSCEDSGSSRTLQGRSLSRGDSGNHKGTNRERNGGILAFLGFDVGAFGVSDGVNVVVRGEEAAVDDVIVVGYVVVGSEEPLEDFDSIIAPWQEDTESPIRAMIQRLLISHV